MAAPNVTGGITEYFSPGEHLTMTAAEAIVGGNVVKLTANRTVSKGTAAAAAAIGVALYDAGTGDLVTVAVGGVWPLKASGAISAGDLLTPAAAGAVSAASGANPVIAMALEAIADGATGRCLIIHSRVAAS